MKFKDYISEQNWKKIAKILSGPGKTPIGKTPKKGDIVQDYFGKRYPIYSVNKGIAYCDTGTIKREVFPIKDLVPDKTENVWLEK